MFISKDDKQVLKLMVGIVALILCIIFRDTFRPFLIMLICFSMVKIWDYIDKFKKGDSK